MNYLEIIYTYIRLSLCILSTKLYYYVLKIGVKRWIKYLEQTLRYYRRLSNKKNEKYYEYHRDYDEYKLTQNQSGKFIMGTIGLSSSRIQMSNP